MSDKEKTNNETNNPETEELTTETVDEEVAVEAEATVEEEKPEEPKEAESGTKDKKEKRDKQLTEIYKLSQINKIPEKIPVQLNYSNATMIVQTFPNKKLNELIEILHTNSWIRRKTLTADDKEKLLKRLELAKNWMDKYAPEEVKFIVQEEVPKDLKLNNKEKEALHLVADTLKKKEWEQKNLFEEFYNICEKTGIKNTEFFKAAYNVLLNKDRGPKLAPFILTLGKEKIIELFEKI